MRFHEILRERRKALGMTQQDIADIFSIKSINVSDWERGEGMPEAGRLPALAKKLGLSISELMGEKIRHDSSLIWATDLTDMNQLIELMTLYKASSVTGKNLILDTARAAAQSASEIGGLSNKSKRNPGS